MLTIPFADQLDRAMAYYPTDRPMPSITLNHPMQMITDDEINDRAVQLVEAAIALLDGES